MGNLNALYNYFRKCEEKMKACDYYSDERGGYWCMLKKGEVSSTTYRDFCKCDEMQKCPIYLDWKENGGR